MWHQDEKENDKQDFNNSFVSFSHWCLSTRINTTNSHFRQRYLSFSIKRHILAKNKLFFPSYFKDKAKGKEKSLLTLDCESDTLEEWGEYETPHTTGELLLLLLFFASEKGHDERNSITYDQCYNVHITLQSRHSVVFYRQKRNEAKVKRILFI
jgi:hypothetical protein